jgi:hypothetical protein
MQRLQEVIHRRDILNGIEVAVQALLLTERNMEVEGWHYEIADVAVIILSLYD